MAFDGLSLLLGGGAAGLIAAGGKIWKDVREARTADKKEDNAAATAETHGQSEALKTTSEALAASNLTASQWMERYARVLENQGALNEKYNAQEKRIAGLEADVKALRSERDGAQAEAKQKEAALKREQAAHGETTKRAVRAETRAEKAEEERDTFRQGFQAAMLMVETQTTGKGDEALMAVAEDTIKRVADYINNNVPRSAGEQKRK